MEASQVKAWIAADFGISLSTLSAVSHGADVLAQVWHGMTESGDSYAIKLTAGGSAAGLVVPALLHQAGVPGIAAPLSAGDRLWSEHEGRRLSVVPWINGSQAFRCGLSRPQWTALGETLAHVHSVQPAADLPEQTYTHQHLWQLAHEVDVAMKEPADSLAAALKPLWAQSRAWQLLERADTLAAELGTPLNVLCHSDPHLGNVLVDAAGQIWLIDWDDAILAPRERDLLFFVGGVLAFAPVTPEQQAWFFDGYGPVDLDPGRLTYHRCVRALEDLTGPAAQIVSPRHWDETERAFALSIVEGVVSPTGLVLQALETWAS